MIIWILGAAAMTGLVALHLLNLARYRRQVFNQLHVVERVAKENRVVRQVRQWLLLAMRLGLVGTITAFIATYAHTEEQGQTSTVLIPTLPYLSQNALRQVDSLLHRGGVGSQGRIRVVTADPALKAVFPEISLLRDNDLADRLKARDELTIDSLTLIDGTPATLERASDTSFSITTDTDYVVLNGKRLAPADWAKPLGLAQQASSELKVADRIFYFTQQIQQPKFYLAPRANALAPAFNPAIFKKVATLVEASLWVGALAFEEPVKGKAVVYLPATARQATQDLAQLGVAAQVEAEVATKQDTFDQIDQAVLRYAFTTGNQPDLPTVVGRSTYKLSGYSVPIIFATGGRPLVSLLPSSLGNKVLFIHADLLGGATNLSQTDLFLPVLYSLAKEVAASRKVSFYDLGDGASKASLAELTAQADSIQYVAGIAQPYLRQNLDRVLLPGLYKLYRQGEASILAVNQIRGVKARPAMGYMQSRMGTTGSSNWLVWVFILIATFVGVEALLLTQRFRQREW